VRVSVPSNGRWLPLWSREKNALFGEFTVNVLVYPVKVTRRLPVPESSNLGVGTERSLDRIRVERADALARSPEDDHALQSIVKSRLKTSLVS
jgi:hypothetical protein